MSNKAKTLTIDQDDVITALAQAMNEAHEIKLLPKPIEQPTDETTLNVSAFRKAIKAQFSGSRAVIDHILSLNLTSDSKDDIERLRVIFYDTWPELSYGKLGQTSGEAIKSREALYSTKSADRTSEQTRVYDATKSAWRWVKEQCELKAPAKKRAANSGTGKTEGEGDKTIDPAKVTSFEELATLSLDVAKLIDLLATKATQAKIKSCGLVTYMSGLASSLRVQVDMSRKEHADDRKATK